MTLLHRWHELPTDYPMEKIARQRVIGEQAMISRVVLEKGCDVPMHAHENEQHVVVLEGRVRFTLTQPDGSTEQVVVSRDEVLLLPSNLPHAAFAEERSIVLDVFSPPSATTGIDD